MHHSSRRAGSSRPAGARRLRLMATVAGSVAAALAPVLPWASSGRAVRSGFALARLGRSPGLAATWPGRGLLVAVALLPLMAALAWTAAWLGATGWPPPRGR